MVMVGGACVIDGCEGGWKRVGMRVGVRCYCIRDYIVLFFFFKQKTAYEILA